MRDRLRNFMMGRNGVDELARFETFLIWIPVVLMLIFRSVPVVSTVANVLFWVLFIHSYYRVLSRDLVKRGEENRKYLNWRYQMALKRNKTQKRMQQMQNYRFYKCPKCSQEVRVPKGHGKIEITCPKCREKFVRRS